MAYQPIPEIPWIRRHQGNLCCTHCQEALALPRLQLPRRVTNQSLQRHNEREHKVRGTALWLWVFRHAHCLPVLSGVLSARGVIVNDRRYTRGPRP